MLMRDRGRLRAWKMPMWPLSSHDGASRGAALLTTQAARLVPAGVGAADPPLALSMSTTSGIPVAAVGAASATAVGALVEKVDALVGEGSRHLRR